MTKIILSQSTTYGKATSLYYEIMKIVGGMNVGFNDDSKGPSQRRIIFIEPKSLTKEILEIIKNSGLLERIEDLEEAKASTSKT